jgi:hypothetical protein
MISILDTDILATQRRRLHKLEQQAARSGHNTPPEIAIEIEDLRRKLDPAAVPETDAERFIFLRDLIQLGRQETAELRRDVRWLYALLPIILLVLAVVEKL